MIEELPDDSDEKPRTASLFASMRPESITLDEALRLLTLPRTVGVDPTTGEEIVAMNGRYGPFVKKGSESRSLESRGAALHADGRGGAGAASPSRSRGGSDSRPPRSGSSAPIRRQASRIVVKDGRFGPYVTDGETNASLRSGDSVESLTLERAAELLAERSSRGPAKKRKQRSAQIIH